MTVSAARSVTWLRTAWRTPGWQPPHGRPPWPLRRGQFFTAPPQIREALYSALDVQALYRQDKNQMTVWVTITDATPDAIQALLDDPRTDNHTASPPQTHRSTATSTPDFTTL